MTGPTPFVESNALIRLQVGDEAGAGADLDTMSVAELQDLRRVGLRLSRACSDAIRRKFKPPQLQRPDFGTPPVEQRPEPPGPPG